jgi:protease I
LEFSKSRLYFSKEVFMAKNVLNGKKIAVLVTDGFEQVELVKPRKALDKAGGQTVLIAPVAPTSQSVRGWKETKWGSKFNVDVPLDQASVHDYDALLLPGGVMNPDKLRLNAGAIEFVRHFVETGKPIAAICHGPQLLIEGDAVRGRRMTSWPSLKTDLSNAGAQWVDETVVVDGNLVTSRKPDDIPQFNEAMINEFAMAFAKPREEKQEEVAPVL